MSIDKNDSTFSEFCLKYIENFKDCASCTDPNTKQDITNSSIEFTIGMMIMSGLKVLLDKLDEFESKCNNATKQSDRCKNKIAKSSFKCNKKFCGYNLYIHEKSEQAKLDGTKINLSDIATDWNKLPADVKNDYNIRANQIRIKKNVT